jgi:transcriptional regulator with XRE-family HTH domain
MSQSPQSTRAILAKNLTRLLAVGAAHGLPSTQAALSRRSGVSQKTISNWLDPSRGVAPVLDKLELVADVYRLEVWQLLVPDLPDDMLLIGHLKRLVANYGNIANPAARRYIEQIAEAEANYAPALASDEAPQRP